MNYEFYHHEVNIPMESFLINLQFFLLIPDSALSISTYIKGTNQLGLNFGNTELIKNAVLHA